MASFDKAHTSWQQKVRIPRLLYRVVCVILGLAVLVEPRLVTDGRIDRQTDRQTHDDSIYRASIASPGNMVNDRDKISLLQKIGCHCVTNDLE